MIKTLYQGLALALSMYLPMLLFLALSALSYWIWQSEPDPSQDDQAARSKIDPEMVLFDAALQRFDATSGQLRMDLSGKVILRHMADQTLEVQNAQGRQVATDGTRSAFSAHTVWMTEDGDEARLIGDALVSYQRPGLPESRMSSQHLHVSNVTRVVQSDVPVRFERGGDVVQAGTMHYNAISGMLALGAGVRATLIPTAAPSATVTTP